MTEATMKKVGIGLVAGGVVLPASLLIWPDGGPLLLGMLLPIGGTYIYLRAGGLALRPTILMAAVPLFGPPVVLALLVRHGRGLPVKWLTLAPSLPEVRDAGQESGSNRRRSAGRLLPYRVLRVLARVYIVLAPLILGTMLLIGLILLMVDGPVPTRVGTFIGMSLIGGMYYLLMKSAAQAIYLMFDVASSTNLIHELHDAVKLQAVEQEKLANSFRELSAAVRGGGQGTPRAST